MLVVDLSSSKGFPNSKSCKSFGRSHIALGNKNRRRSFIKPILTECRRSTRNTEWRVQLRSRYSSVSLLPHEHKR